MGSTAWPASARIRRLGVLAAACLAWALLAFNTAAWRQGDLAQLRTPRRFWEDLSVAISRHLGEGDPIPIGSWRGQSQADDYQRFILKTVAAQDLGPWPPWRTIRMARFEGSAPLAGRPSDDPGRAGLLRIGFAVLGGVAPFLPFWLGALGALPIFLWVAWELAEGGAPVAAVVFPSTLAASPYFVEVLSLPYSAVGFYVLALVALAALAAHTILGECRPRRLLVRAVAAGLCVALCALCRGGTLLLIPGFLLALAIGAWRAAPGLRRSGPLAALLSAALLLPYALAAPAGRHEIWLGVWEGLGDFDRTKGHYWLDIEAKAFLRGAGIDAPDHRPVWAKAMENEAFFRDRVIADVMDDPAWYASILGQRLFATVTQSKLWPYRPREGRSIARHASRNEGAIDTYYKLTTPVDFVGVGSRRREIPVGALALPTLLLLAAWAAAPRLRLRRERVARLVAILAPLAAAALISPLIITTASAMETEAFALVYLLGFALLLDLIRDSYVSRVSGSPQ